MTYDDREPEVTLLDGSVVNEALYEWVRDLLERGHSIKVSDRGDVSVSPPCNPDVLFHFGRLLF